MSEHLADGDYDSPIYYRLYWPTDKDPCVVTMQWFDEFDYDQQRFLSDAQFDTEADAEKGLEDALCHIVAQRAREIEKALAPFPSDIVRDYREMVN